MRRSYPIIVILFLVALTSVGCGPTGEALYVRFSDEDPFVRKEAIVTAEQIRDKKTLALIVDRLSDTDSVVRLTAILALEKWVGKTMGYVYYKNARQRDVAIVKWRQWLVDCHKGSFMNH